MKRVFIDGRALFFNGGGGGNRIMIRIIGDTIAVLPELKEGEPLPSPESLRGKIIIKGKVVKEGEVRMCSRTSVKDTPESEFSAKKSVRPQAGEMSLKFRGPCHTTYSA